VLINDNMGSIKIGENIHKGKTGRNLTQQNPVADDSIQFSSVQDENKMPRYRRDDRAMRRTFRTLGSRRSIEV